MTDRELLELAAKAAGIELWHEDVFTKGLTQKISQNGILCWNPLTDDGDALRLAVKLRLSLEWWQIGVSAHSQQYELGVIEHFDGAPQASTRRAITRAAAEIGITRAAAEIGKAMK
jgi:hypothetical protein